MYLDYLKLFGENIKMTKRGNVRKSHDPTGSMWCPCTASFVCGCDKLYDNVCVCYERWCIILSFLYGNNYEVKKYIYIKTHYLYIIHGPTPV